MVVSACVPIEDGSGNLGLSRARESLILVLCCKAGINNGERDAKGLQDRLFRNKHYTKVWQSHSIRQDVNRAPAAAAKSGRIKGVRRAGFADGKLTPTTATRI
ncbi:hypothetical protein chiPu_0016015 [Chiloscyllium punctatum]|uniref:Uncharacterized protein n=1 Tax=Chiloscyllium punctatum TaxID=137246 RepID=A0A401T4B6_CHIPU|nr:hypothetical protein [Chiloscyllium punctatum]